MKSRPKFIAFAGASGSGKTTASEKLRAHLGEEKCVVISADNFYKCQKHLPMEERRLVNYDHPDAYDYDLLFKAISGLSNGHAIAVPGYDFATYSRTNDSTIIQPTLEFVIVEGILILHSDSLNALFDVKIYVKADLDICLLRRLERDVIKRGRDCNSVLTQYITTVRPMFFDFVKPTEKKADIIFENKSPMLPMDIQPIIEYLRRKASPVTPENIPPLTLRKTPF